MKKITTIALCIIITVLLSSCAKEKEVAASHPLSASSSTLSSSNSDPTDDASSLPSSSTAPDSSSGSPHNSSSESTSSSASSGSNASYSSGPSSSLSSSPLSSEGSSSSPLSSGELFSSESSSSSETDPSSSDVLSSSSKASSTNSSSSASSAYSSNALSSSTVSSLKPSSPSSNSSMIGPTSSNSTPAPDDEIVVVPPEEDDRFLPQKYRIYDSLSPLQQEYYNNMLEGISNMHTGWIVLGESRENYMENIALVRAAVLADHPEIFWLPSFYATAEATSASGKKTAVIYFTAEADAPPSYLYSARDKERMEKELDKAVNNILEKLTAKTPYEIELQLHDLLCEIAEYNNDDSDPSIYTAYGALVKKKALCEGYSKAMQLLLEKCGIAATVVSGVADGEDHMWNLVMLNNEWYNLDVTWDDMQIAVSHEYFNLSDEMISLDHHHHPSADEIPPEEMSTGIVHFNINRPQATGTEYNYFNRSGFILFADGVSSLGAYLARTEGNFVEVRFSDKTFRDRVYADSDAFVARINEILKKEQKGCGFTIGGYSVSSTVLRLYKKEI